MPEMDGFEMLSKILEILSKKYQSNGGASEMQFVHIYAVTAMNESQIKDNHKQYGIKEILSKPVRPEVLSPILESIFKVSGI